MRICKIVFFAFVCVAIAFPLWVVARGWQGFGVLVTEVLFWFLLVYMSGYFFVYSFPTNRLAGWLASKRHDLMRRFGF